MNFPPDDNLGADMLIQWTWKLSDGADYSEHVVVNFPKVTQQPSRQFSIVKVGTGLLDPSGEIVKQLNIDWFASTSSNNYFDKNQANGPSGSNFNEKDYWTWINDFVQTDARFQYMEFKLKRKEPANDNTKISVGFNYYDKCSEYDQQCIENEE